MTKAISIPSGVHATYPSHQRWAHTRVVGGSARGTLQRPPLHPTAYHADTKQLRVVIEESMFAWTQKEAILNEYKGCQKPQEECKVTPRVLRYNISLKFSLLANLYPNGDELFCTASLQRSIADFSKNRVCGEHSQPLRLLTSERQGVGNGSNQHQNEEDHQE
eukprot:4533388-Amphidinium_carterae.1